MLRTTVLHSWTAAGLEVLHDHKLLTQFFPGIKGP